MGIHTKDTNERAPIYPALSRYITAISGYYRDTGRPLDRATIAYFEDPSSLPEALSGEVKKWNTIAKQHLPNFGFERPTGYARLPIHPREFGSYENARAYFGSMEGANRLMTFAKAPFTVGQDLQASVEPGEQNKYASVVGVHLDLPWPAEDPTYGHVRKRYAHKLANVGEGRIPALLLDADFDTENNAIYTYESARHKFGEWFGVKKTLHVPDADANYGLPFGPHAADPLTQNDPQAVALYDAIGDELKKRIGGRHTDFYKFSLKSLLRIGEQIFSKPVSRLWFCSPKDILKLRGEDMMASQMDFSHQDAALQSALTSVGKAETHVSQNSHSTRWYVVANPLA